MDMRSRAFAAGLIVNSGVLWPKLKQMIVHYYFFFIYIYFFFLFFGGGGGGGEGVLFLLLSLPTERAGIGAYAVCEE